MIILLLIAVLNTFIIFSNWRNHLNIKNYGSLKLEISLCLKSTYESCKKDERDYNANCMPGAKYQCVVAYY